MRGGDQDERCFSFKKGKDFHFALPGSFDDGIRPAKLPDSGCAKAGVIAGHNQMLPRVQRCVNGLAQNRIHAQKNGVLFQPAARQPFGQPRQLPAFRLHFRRRRKRPGQNKVHDAFFKKQALSGRQRLSPGSFQRFAKLRRRGRAEDVADPQVLRQAQRQPADLLLGTK